MQGKKIEEELTLKSGEKRKLDFSPQPKESGLKDTGFLLCHHLVIQTPQTIPFNNYRQAPDGFNPYLSNRVQPIYPFLKRNLANEERFDFKARENE